MNMEEVGNSMDLDAIGAVGEFKAIEALFGDDKELFVFRNCIASGRRMSLTEVARRFQVTRQRIQQIEVKISKLVDFELSPDRSPSFAAISNSYLQEVGTLVPSGSELLATWVEDSLAILSNADRQSIKALVFWKLKVVEKSLRGISYIAVEPFTFFEDLETFLDQKPIVDADAVAELLDLHGVLPAAFKEIIENDGRYRMIDSHLVRWNRNLVEDSITVLRFANAPLTIDQIAGSLGRKVSRRSLANRLLENPRTVRAGASLFGLVEWNIEPYGSIVQSITNLLEHSQSPIPIEEVVNELSKTRNVRAQSVRAYLAAPCFVVEDASVRMRQTDEPFSNDHDPALGANVYVREDGGFSWVTPVDGELLRGSGRPLTCAQGAAMKVLPHAPRSFKTPFGDVRFSWNESAFSPTVSTLRLHSDGVGACEGDFLRLECRGDGTGDVFRIGPEILTCPPSLDAVAEITGIGNAPEGFKERLLRSLWTPNGVSVQSILSRRGEEMLLRVVPEEYL
jgi:hypothetical protein